MMEWVTIIEAAKKIGVSPQAVRYWVDFKGLESRSYTPDFGKTTTLVNMNDVFDMDERRKKKGARGEGE